MKLQLRKTGKGAAVSGVLALTDEAGEMLPNQVKVWVDEDKVLVEFSLHGDGLTLSDQPTK